VTQDLGAPQSWKQPRAWRFPLGLWLATRVALVYLGYLSLALVPAMVKQGGSPALRRYPALDALCRWDCGWFVLLAQRGYASATETNFWPGLSVAARLLEQAIKLPIPFGVLLISNLACLGAYLVIYRLFWEQSGEPAARTSLTVFAAFPFAFFHASGYPETLMIFFSAAAVFLALRGHHVRAGLALGLGVLSRHLTILMGGALLAAQLQQRGWRRFFHSPLGLVGLAMPFAAIAVYAVYCARAWGDPLSFWKARNDWGATAWWSVVEVFRHIKERPHIALFVIFALLPAAGAAAYLRRPRMAVLGAAVLPLIVVLWLIGAFGLGRYAASCWPAFLPIGEWLERHPAFKTPLLIVLGIAQGWFFFLHTHHYEIQ
jgi:hypothetical protein